MTASLTDHYKISSHVRSQTMDDESVILDLKSGKYFGLNEIGVAVWDRIASTGSLDGLSDELSVIYDTAKEVIEKDIIALLDELLTHELLILAGEK